MKNVTFFPYFALLPFIISLISLAGAQQRLTRSTVPPSSNSPAAGKTEQTRPPPTSLVVRRDHTLVRLAPTRRIRRRGVVMKNARLPILETALGPGCAEQWYRVHTDAWICGNDVQLSHEPPQAAQYPIIEANQLTPWSYGFVREDAMEYRWNHGYLQEKREVHKGFGFGIQHVVQIDGESFFRTAEGTFIPKASAGVTQRISDFSGVRLTSPITPFGWINSRRAWAYAVPELSKQHRVRQVERFSHFNVRETRKTGRRTFYRIDDDTWLFGKDVRIHTTASLPKGLDPGEKWIDVDTRQQIVTAYEGSTPVYSTLSSTGRIGASRTVKGQYRIWAKVSAIAMDNTDEALEELPVDGGLEPDAGLPPERKLYSLHDVPWTQFFFENYALHGVYWHSRFGNRRSHGCVNLAPKDARWFYNWTHPTLPDGWWAIHSSPSDRGTLVRVR